MPLYGDFDQQFRPRPSAAALLAVSTGSILGATVLLSALRGAIGLLIAFLSGVRNPLELYAPFPPEVGFLYSPESLPGVGAMTPLILPGLLLLFSVAIGRFWPGSQTLAGRLCAMTLSSTFAMFGGLAPAFHPELFDHVSGALPPIGWSVLIGGVSGWLILRAERKTVDLLGTLFPAESVGTRLRLWLLRLPVGLSLVAIAAFLERRQPVAYAAVAALAITLLENISRRPRRYFEQLMRPLMHEAAATLPILALLLTGGSVWLFGSIPLHRPARAVLIRSGHVSLGPLPGGALTLEMQKEPEHGPKKPPRMKIQWSKDRTKGKTAIVVP